MTYRQRLSLAINAFPRHIGYPTGHALKPKHAAKLQTGWVRVTTLQRTPAHMEA